MSEFGSISLPMSIINDSCISGTEKCLYGYLLRRSKNGYNTLKENIGNHELAKEINYSHSLIGLAINNLEKDNLVATKLSKDNHREEIEVRINEEDDRIHIPSFVSDNPDLNTKEKIFFGMIFRITDNGTKEMMIKSLYPLSKINEVTINAYINAFADLGYISVCGKRNKTFIFKRDITKRILSEK